jgi:predicted nucleic acid-binding protein
LSPAQAAANVSRLLTLPQVRTLREEDGFWQIYSRVAEEFPVRGNAVPDAHIAALLRQHGVGMIYTNDADFKRFSFLKVRSPFERDSAARRRHRDGG